MLLKLFCNWYLIDHITILCMIKILTKA